MANIVVLVCLTALILEGDAARILGIVSTPSYSHQVVFQALWRELSLRGHQVTTLTTDPINDPALTNLTEINLQSSYETWNNLVNDEVHKNDHMLIVMYNFISKMVDIQDAQMQHPAVQALLKSDQKFDLLMIESLLPGLFGFAHKFQCPTISMASMDGFSYQYKQMGNPTHPILYPDILYAYNEKMTFSERLHSTFITSALDWIYMYGQYLQDQFIKKHFGPNSPPIDSIMRNTSMFFVNTDMTFHKIRPLLPNVIQIGGGSHIKSPTTLPRDLQKVLDNAKNGFIYFSLGSNVLSKDIPLETRATIIKTFSELPYTILWKFEADSLPNKPDNVIILKWVPQQDVLRHPNIKLFITQGGLQSSDETIYAGVPIVGMPFIGDQVVNIKKWVDKGIGLSVDHTRLTTEDFRAKILEVIQNPRYRNRVAELATLARDQPMTGLGRAVWWTEYVIRHKGAKHLRSPLLDIPCYQYLLLDVVAVLLFGVTLVLYILYILVRYTCRTVTNIFTRRKKKLQ